MITNFKIFENNKHLSYKIGDYVKYMTLEDWGTLYYGKVIDKSEPEYIDELPTVHYTVKTTEKEMSLWQTENGGEIVDYWDLTPEEKKNFELEVKAKKYNL